MFASSLGNKELFHSNFLGWVLEKSPSTASGKLKKLFWGNLPSLKGALKVKREKNKFDLVLFDEGNKNSCVVIENKFKSLPDLEQLKKYSEKIKNFSNIRKILLAPESSLNVFKEELNGLDWDPVSYEEVLSALDVETEEPFITAYSGFVRILLDEIKALNKEFANGDEVDAFFFQKSEAYEDLRISDLFEKQWAARLYHQLTQVRLKKEEFRKNRLEFTNKSAILNFFKPSSPQCDKESSFYGIQIQNRKLRVAVYFPQRGKSRDLGNALADEDHVVRRFILDTITGIKLRGEKPKFEEFTNPKQNSLPVRSYRAKNGDGVFLYEQIDLSKSKLKIGELREVIRKILNRMDKFWNENRELKDFRKAHE